MKRLLLIFVCLAAMFSAFSQTATYYHYTSDHYRVNSDSSEETAKSIAMKMEAALPVFNDILHFDLSKLDSRLKVTIFEDKEDFDSYLNNILKETREDFVYIHYSDIAKSELVGFQKENEDSFDSSLLHQGFIQLFKAYIPNPPLWLREGLATYFDNSVYDEQSGSLRYKTNLLWLDSLKAMLAAAAGSSTAGSVSGSIIPLTEFLMMDRDSVQDKLESFYPQAWGIVAFLHDSPMKSYNRMLWDSLGILEPSSTLSENSQLILKSVMRWVDENTVTEDFVSFISSLATFNDLVAGGIDLYTSGDLADAKQNFLKAISLEPQSFIPYYYLGLIDYTQKDYGTADENYKKALGLGADEALTSYALGVNAFADNQFEVAMTYLNDAKKEDPGKYRDKVDSLLQRIETLR